MKKNQHLFLIGFMGAGKSTIGAKLAQKMTREFLDLDKRIEIAEEMTIPELFSSKGERYFREKESEYLKEINGDKVIATGGGILYFEDTLSWMKENGTIVYLHAPFSVLHERIAQDINRPVAVRSTKDQLEKIFNERHTKFQRAAEISVSTHCEVEETISDIMKKIKQES
ncbi:shikimate kinase [Jeotgalibacillus sp. ET6]|uniref:shikimate kinase n=1 Tax=Jeotgalibacillus sp. ET6 TaxID=3037260 RepID=UPI002418AEBA|nr:shikimate kinase [Jeotgalibacillus sp. ET6]MDG5470788.1 shikimate kinase [Jeotgalibacillus sp. ET6]